MSAATAAVLTPVSVAESYRYCRKIARQRAKNFYYSFLLLEKPQRDAMCAIYAFMRQCDDLSDEPASKDKELLRQSIRAWRMQLNRALTGDVSDGPIWPAFYDTVQRYAIPHRFFHEIAHVDGIGGEIELALLDVASAEMPVLEVVAENRCAIGADEARNAVDRRRAGICRREIEQDLERVRLPNIVVIQEDDELRGRIGLGKPQIARGGDAAVFPTNASNPGIPRGKAFNDAGRGVARSIVDDDQLPLAEGLRQDAFDRGRKEALSVIGRDDDRDLQRAISSSFLLPQACATVR